MSSRRLRQATSGAEAGADAGVAAAAMGADATAGGSAAWVAKAMAPSDADRTARAARVKRGILVSPCRAAKHTAGRPRGEPPATRGYSIFTVRRRSALLMTLTDDSAIAAAATTGDSSHPKNGYSTPAASGMPATL